MAKEPEVFRFFVEETYDTNKPDNDLSEALRSRARVEQSYFDYIEKEKDKLQLDELHYSQLSEEAINDIKFNHDVNYYNSEEATYIPTWKLSPSTFLEDFADEMELGYIGQAIKAIQLDNGYHKFGYDPSFDPYTEENIAGYEFYAGKFQNVLNKQHMDKIKSVIDSNQYTRERLGNSERWFFPALLSGVLDPINLISLNPALRGAATFGQRFRRGGAAITGIVLPTEIVRQRLDPTSTNMELALNLGTSYVIGGLLTGALGKNINSKVYTDTIKAKGGPASLADNYNNALSGFGADNADYNWDWNPRLEVIGLDPKPQIVRGKTNKDVEIVLETDKKASYIKLNIDQLKSKWNKKSAQYKKLIGNYNNFEKLELKKAVARDVYQVQRNNGETLEQFDARLENSALRDFYMNRADRDTDTNMIGRFLEKFTSYGKVFNNTTVKNKTLRAYLQDSFFSLAGDYATKSVANRSGKTFNGSVLLDIHVNWDGEIRTLKQVLDSMFVEHRKSIAKEDGGSTELLTYNLTKQRMRAGDAYEKVLNRVAKRKKNIDKIEWNDFKNIVFKGIVDDEIYDNIKSPSIKKAVDDLRQITAKFHNENEKYGLYANPLTLKRKMANYRGYIIELENLIARETNPIKIREYKAIRENIRVKENQLNSFYNKNNAFFKLDSFTPEAKNYLPLMFDREAIIKNKQKFINFLAEKFNDPQYYKYVVIDKKKGEIARLDTSEVARKKRAEEVVNRILDEDIDDVDGILGRGKDEKGNFKYGVFPFKKRALNLPHKEFLKENNGIDDFVVTDVEYLLRTYIQRDSMAIETAKRFGDPHLEQWNIETKIRYITDEVESEEDLVNMNTMLDLMESEHAKMRGTLSLEDPASMNRRGAAFLRDWTSLATMGKVVISATADLGRPIMVNGFRKTFGVGLNNLLANQEGYFRAVDNLRYMGVAAEVALGMSRKRFIEDGGMVGKGSSKLGRIFDKVADFTNNVQGAFYTANGLMPWTQMMKDFQGIISAHRLIEDSLKWSTNNLDEFGQQRLLSYGIDKKTADLISKMPYEDLDGLYTVNADNWGSISGGLTASRKFKEALYADINRTIITPSSTDQINMMHGVVKVKNPKYVDYLESNKIAQFLGFQRTEYGGQFSNAWVGLPFQFFSWGFAANRRLVISGMQGRERDMMSGIVAMITLGAMADRMKNTRAWQNKSTEEKIIRAVEQSGVLGLMGDLNFMAETVSEGLFNYPIGLRPLVGAEPRFGEANVIDATGEFIGAGPGLVLDMAFMFGSDSTFNQRRDAARRLLPLQNLWLIDNQYKSIYNSIVEPLRAEDIEE